MPHVEIKYSEDLALDHKALFNVIQKTINQFDSSAGACKSRAYPTDKYLHTHVLINVYLLTKDYRNDEFTKNLTEALLKEIKDIIKQPCFLSFELCYKGKNYITTKINEINH